MAPVAVLDFLAGLVTEVPRHIGDGDDDHHARKNTDVIEVRLAHFSIKEYLMSPRMSSNISATFGIKEIDANIRILKWPLIGDVCPTFEMLGARMLKRVYRVAESVCREIIR